MTADPSAPPAGDSREEGGGAGQGDPLARLLEAGLASCAGVATHLLALAEDLLTVAERALADPAAGGTGGGPSSTAAFLRRALDTMRRRSPHRYAGVLEHLRRAPGHVEVGGERFTVGVEGDRVTVRPGWRGEAPARVQATTAAVLALVDGARSLREVLADEALVVRGSADTLLELHAAVSLFATEAVGTTDYVGQLQEYRAWATGR